ncbi:MAG: VOC family protein [Methanobacteriota archaeon]|nr:MAG: VOC family protein [Euryarchaeota archaeon]
MPEEPKHGSFTHIEIPVKNKEKSKEFYGEVFGWKFEEVPEMEYTLFYAPDPPHGGLFVPEKDQPSTGVLNHINVDSVDETSQKIEDLGGKILVPKTEVPKIGWFAVFQDPDGSTQAIFEATPRPEE